MKPSSRRTFLKSSAATIVAGGSLLNSRVTGWIAGAQPLPSSQANHGGSGTGVPGSLAAVIDVQKTTEPVSKYLFGMFIENLGPLVYRSLWSELLDDRKFYFPISSKEPAAPARRGGGPGREALRRWRPVGPDAVVVMDKSDPFVGDQSPRIELGSAAHGVRQSGLSLVKGKKYVGRIYLRGTPGSTVKVSLIWGKAGSEREVHSFSLASDAYKKYPLSFTAQADTTDGVLEIVGAGAGDFHVGTVSLMPADNVEGFRPDTTALLRQLHSGFWRLPGGNFLSDWSWYDGVGDIDKRPPTFDYAWNAMQPNDVGLDEFMTLCRLIGVEPYITVNAGFGDEHSAAEEVEYINGSADTRLGAERARNGHPEPYHVKFWNIGNEPWGTFQLGYTPLKYYVLKHNKFAKAMRKVDPSITLIGSAKMLDDMFLTGEARIEHTGNLGPLFGSKYDWTGGLIEHCWGNFDGIAQHWYGQGGRRFNMALAKTLPASARTDDAYVPVEQTPLEWCGYAANGIHRNAEQWQGYQRRFPEMVKKKIFLSLDEYAYFGGSFGAPPDLKLALAYAMIFNEMLRHTDFLTFSAHTMGVSTLDYNGVDAIFNTTGLVFKLYSEHFPGSIPVALAGNSPQPAPQYPIGGDQPRTNAGSPTYPLDMFAALTPDRKFLSIAVTNVTDSQQTLDLKVTGVRLAAPAKRWELTGKDLKAANRLGAPPQVTVNEIAMDEAPPVIPVSPISLTIYRFSVV